MDIDVRLLRSFVIVAEERHFGRAAARLFVSSPALSQQVRRLEELVGDRLLERDSRHVALTSCGRAFLPAAREVVAAADRATAVVARLRRSARRTVSVGFMAASSHILPELRLELGRRAPELTLQTHRLEWGEQTSAVTDGRVDASFARSPIDLTDLDAVPVLSEPRVAGLWLDHPLAGRDRLVLADLSGQRMVSSATATEEWRRFWHVDPRPDGTPVPVGPLVENTEEMLEAVAARAAICITAASVPGYYRNPGVVFVTVTDIAPSEVVLCHVRGDARPEVALLVTVVGAVTSERVRGERPVPPDRADVRHRSGRPA